MRDSCDRGEVSDGSRLAVYQTLCIECASILFWHVLCVDSSFLFAVFFCLFFCFRALVGALELL